MKRSSAATWSRALKAIASLNTSEPKCFARFVDELAERHESRDALVSDGERLTYRDLAGKKNRYARWARAQALAPGDVVCLMMANCPSYVPLWLGIGQTGATVALINTNLRHDALHHAIDCVRPRHIIVGAGFEGALGEIASRLAAGITCWTHEPKAEPPLMMQALDPGAYAPDRLPDHEFPAVDIGKVALFIYTSGTTGLPKAARITHRRVLEWSFWFAGLMDTGADDRLYNCLPMYHSTGGVAAIGGVLANGGSVLLKERFSATRFWPDVVSQGCTLFLYIGELCRYLVEAPAHELETRHGLRLCCGNGLGADVWTRFQARFRIPQILEFYASTEGNVSLYNVEGQPGAIGRVPSYLRHRFPVALIECDPDTGEARRDGSGRCLRASPGQPGEAIGRISDSSAGGSAVFDGYDDDAATERKILRNVFADGDAWFRTGDLMRQDQEGFYYFVDRMGDTFRRKGENVATLQVSEAICKCPGVKAAVVYGVALPGEEGRVGMAAITLAGAFDPRQLHAILRDALPSYARPMFVRICSEIATTGTFKFVKTHLMEEGYDPARVADPLYVEDAVAGTYVRI